MALLARVLLSAVTVLGILVVQRPVVAQVPPSLDGEQVSIDENVGSGQIDASAQCIVSATSNRAVVTYSASGSATGPYPGSFIESGIVVGNDRSGSAELSNVAFSITAGQTTVTGVKWTGHDPSGAAYCESTGGFWMRVDSAIYEAVITTPLGTFTEYGYSGMQLRQDSAGVDVYQSQFSPFTTGTMVGFTGSSANLRVVEGIGVAGVSVFRAGDGIGAVTVDYSTQPRSATEGQDYTPVSGTLTWATGDTSPKTINIPIINDVVEEGDESFEVHLSNGTGGGILGGVREAKVTVLSHAESPGTFGVTMDANEVAEGGIATLTVGRSQGSLGEVGVSYTTSNGSALAGHDYTPVTGQLTCRDREYCSATIGISIIDDPLRESSETFSVSLHSPTGGVTIAPSGASRVVTIVPSDPTHGSIQFGDGAYRIPENIGTGIVTVTRVGGSDGSVTVDYVSSSGSATSGDDFLPVQGTVTWSDGDAAPKPIGVPFVNDRRAEGDETLALTLLNPSGGATLGATKTTAVTIADDEVTVTACTPRPRVVSQLASSGGELRVRVESTPLNTGQNNQLQELRFGAMSNAQVSLGGMEYTSGQAYAVPTGTVAIEFTVRRIEAGIPSTVGLTVIDACGPWQTFVGGGSSAGF